MSPRVLAPILLLSTLAVAGCSPRSRVEATGPPMRICSVTLAGDEILADLVPPERVVAVTTFVDDPTVSNAAGHYPDDVTRIAVVDLEQVLALEPDLVIPSQHNDADFLALLARTGLRTVPLSAHASFADVRRTYLELGDAVGEAKRAKELLAWMDAGRRELETALAGVADRPRVLFWAYGSTSGPRTTVGELIELAGAHNVARDLGIEATAEVDTERVIAARPDRLLLSRWQLADEEGYSRLPESLQGLYTTDDGTVIELPGRLLDALSVRLVEGAWTLASVLHPDHIDPEALDRIRRGPPPR